MISFEAPSALAPVIDTIQPRAFDRLAPIEPHYVITVLVVDPDEMKVLNASTRRVKEPTDVLSFPLYGSAADRPAHDAPLGDIFICPSYVDETKMGLRECLIHGTLHLLGFDHEADLATWDDARAKVE